MCVFPIYFLLVLLGVENFGREMRGATQIGCASAAPFSVNVFQRPNERARALEFLIITVAKVFAFSLDFD